MLQTMLWLSLHTALPSKWNDSRERRYWPQAGRYRIKPVLLLLSLFGDGLEHETKRHSRRFFLPVPIAAVGVVGGAGPFGTDHAGADGILRRAYDAEELAVPGVLDAPQNRAALAAPVIGDAAVLDGEAGFGVEGSKLTADLQGRVGQRAQAPPFEFPPQFEDLGHRS